VKEIVVPWGNDWKLECEGVGVGHDVIAKGDGSLGKKTFLNVRVAQLNGEVGVSRVPCPGNCDCSVANPAYSGGCGDDQSRRGEQRKSGEQGSESEHDYTRARE